MTYQGGKQRLGKEIYQIIVERTDLRDVYFEPFCGILGVGKFALSHFKQVLFCDKNPDIIKIWKDTSYIPSTTPPSKEDFLSGCIHPLEKYACSYSGISGGGYRPFSIDKYGKKHDFYNRFIKNISQTRKQVKNAVFLESKDYSEFKPKGMTIYCDPPYLNNKFKCPYFNDFDHVKFWDTMRLWSRDNNVFISEYQAPDDFTCIWEKQLRVVHSGKKRNKIEKLFIYSNYV